MYAVQPTNYLDCIANALLHMLFIFHSGGCTYPLGFCNWEGVYFQYGDNCIYNNTDCDHWPFFTFCCTLIFVYGAYLRCTRSSKQGN